MNLIAQSIPDREGMVFRQNAANRPCPTYIPAMPWQYFLTLDSFSRARIMDALNTL